MKEVRHKGTYSDFIYTRFKYRWKWFILVDIRRVAVNQGGIDWKGTQETIRTDENVLHYNWGIGSVGCTFVKVIWVMHLRSAHLISPVSEK